MANTTSAQKAMRQAERRAIRNRAARSAIRTYVKKATEAVLGPADAAAEVVRRAVSELDKSVHKGIVHRNAAARRKSRLMGRLYRLTQASAAAPVAAPETKPTRAPARRTSASGTPRASAAKTVAKPASTAKKPAAPRKPAAKKT